MKLNIAGTRTIQEVQHDFSAAYPFLKIEFFNPLRKAKTTAANMLVHSLKIQEARRKQQDGYLELYDAMKVQELELALKDIYGLNAQVFRRSGNIWLETTMTDSWTLKTQNDHGREISTRIS